jgi:hypothetical protein
MTHSHHKAVIYARAHGSPEQWADEAEAVLFFVADSEYRQVTFCGRDMFLKTSHTLHTEVPFNPWIMEQENFLLLKNWVHFVPLFLKLFSTTFLRDSINRLN